MNDEEFQWQMDNVRKMAEERLLNAHRRRITYLRVGPMPRPTRSSFEESLSPEDRELLRAMGIAV